MNSISTIFTMDIYRDLIAPGREESHYVGVGRLLGSAIVIAVALARPFLEAWKAPFKQFRVYWLHSAGYRFCVFDGMF